jgi:hypothetical protein
MSVDDLAAETAAGRPVICCCQDYVAQNSDPRDPQAAWDYGHWMTCLGVIGQAPDRFLVFQDSSEENMERLPGGDVPKADEDPETVVEEPGRRFVSEKRWIPAWHDEAVDGVMYDHYGISVGLPERSTPTAALVETAAASAQRRPSVVDAALAYAAKGWPVIPTDMNKRPTPEHWKAAATTDPDKIRELWAKFPDANIAVQLGAASGLVDIECDTPQAEAEILPLLGGVKTATFRSARGKHRLFLWEASLSDKAFVHVGAIECRTGGNDKWAAAVFPPSTHWRNFQQHTWIDDSPPAPIPPALLAKIQALKSEEAAS